MSNENEFSRLVKIVEASSKPCRQNIEANEAERAALAQRFSLVAVDKLMADITVTRMSDKLRYHVTGRLQADVVQESVSSGQSVAEKIDEEFEAWFIDKAPVTMSAKSKRRQEEEEELGGEIEMPNEEEEPEPITDGVIDVGEVAAQYLGLALNPYPRADGETPHDYVEEKDEKANPFAVLASLKTKE